jgi:hypothetical protein
MHALPLREHPQRPRPHLDKLATFDFVNALLILPPVLPPFEKDLLAVGLSLKAQVWLRVPLVN